MKFEDKINEIKKYPKVYFTFTTWDNFSRRLNPYTYSLIQSDIVVDKIFDKLPSICDIDIDIQDDYPYPLVRAHL